jgi:hypothetical protein
MLERSEDKRPLVPHRGPEGAFSGLIPSPGASSRPPHLLVTHLLQLVPKVGF